MRSRIPERHRLAHPLACRSPHDQPRSIMSLSGFAHATARITVGTLFVGHGLRKLAPVLGGPGLDGATAQMDAVGLRPARPNAVAAGATQLAGGGLLAVGLLTPLAS